MNTSRAEGLNHLYLDTKLEGFSNVAAGLLTRAVGHGLKVAYVDVLGKATKFTNFLENLSLSHSFVRRFDRFSIEIFTFKNNKKISKSILPNVEFYTIPEELLWSSLEKFDLVIFDNCSFDVVHKFSIVNFLDSKPSDLESVFVFSNKEEFDQIKDNFDLVSEYNYKLNPTIGTNKNIINVTGDGKGKSTYSFGFLIRRFIEKFNVKLIYFDKGGDFYGERFFFNSLKKWISENTLYGSFDYVATGLKRFDGKTFRFENVPEDIKEANEGLMLLRTSIKKQTPVIAEELNTTIKTGLLEKEKVLDVLKNVENELMITGRYSPKEVQDLSNLLVEVKEVKHYSKKGYGVKKGVDF